jgi:hypothetical protein
MTFLTIRLSYGVPGFPKPLPFGKKRYQLMRNHPSAPRFS